MKKSWDISVLNVSIWWLCDCSASWCDLWDEDEDRCTDEVMFNCDVADVSGERDVDWRIDEKREKERMMLIKSSLYE